jgi:hypothetical protein
MGKKIFFWGIFCLAVVVTGLIMFSFAQENAGLTRSEVARALVDQMCIEIIPDPAGLPEGESYEVLSNALASRGVNNFLDTDSDAPFTVGEMEEIYNGVAAPEGMEFTDARVKCPAELVDIFAKGADAKLNQGGFKKVLNCFPDCDPTAEAYIVPAAPGFIPGGPQVPEDEPASEI